LSTSKEQKTLVTANFFQKAARNGLPVRTGAQYKGQHEYTQAVKQKKSSPWIRARSGAGFKAKQSKKNG
jgi:hypothetical protein